MFTIPSLAFFYMIFEYFFIKQKQYKQALEYASQVLELVPMDTKALYRRSQAHEALGDLASAFRDMATASRADPSVSWSLI